MPTSAELMEILKENEIEDIPTISNQNLFTYYLYDG